jgi:cell division protease FtsH
LKNVDPIQKVSIVARGQAAGYTLKIPQKDRRLHQKSEFVEELSVLLAGHTSEKIIFGEVTTGATSDLRKATELARSLVTDFGMSEKMIPRTFGKREEMIFLGKEIHEQRDYSEKVAEEIDKEIERFIKEAQEKAEEIINKKRDDLEKIVKVLMENETIEKVEFEKLLGKKEK